MKKQVYSLQIFVGIIFLLGMVSIFTEFSNDTFTKVMTFLLGIGFIYISLNNIFIKENNSQSKEYAKKNKRNN